MAGRIVEAHVDARLAAHAVAADAVVLERLQHRLLEPENVFLDVDAEPAQIDQRIGDDLAGSVVGHLAAAVAAHDLDRAGVEHVLVAPGDALGEDRRMLAEPELVGGRRLARGGERAHRVDREVVGNRAEHLDDHRPRSAPLDVRARP